MNTKPMAEVKPNAYASDLFFNLDHSECETPKGKDNSFGGYDETKLLAQAEWFVSTLFSAGVPFVCSAEATVVDFKARL